MKLAFDRQPVNQHGFKPMQTELYYHPAVERGLIRAMHRAPCQPILINQRHSYLHIYCVTSFVYIYLCDALDKIVSCPILIALICILA